MVRKQNGSGSNRTWWIVGIGGGLALLMLLCGGVGLLAWISGGGLRGGGTSAEVIPPMPADPYPAITETGPVPVSSGVPTGMPDISTWAMGWQFQGLQFSPNDDEMWGDLGDELMANGERAQAWHAYRYAMQLDPDDGEWHNAMRTLNTEWALDAVMRQELANNPSNDELWGDLGDVRRNQGDTASALNCYIRANQLDPADSEWINNLRNMGFQGQLDQGLEAAVQNDPTNDELWGDLGDARLAQGDTQGAIEAWQEALRLDPDDSEWINKLSQHLGSDFNALEMRIDLMQQAAAGARGTPGEDEVLGDLGDVLEEAQRYEEAIEVWQEAQRLDPDDSEWPTSIARVRPLADAGSGIVDWSMPYQESPGRTLADLEQAARGAERVEPWLRYARALVRSGEPAQALTAYQQALAVDPGHDQTQRLVAEARGISRLALLEELIRSHPDNAEVHADQARLLMSLGRRNEAYQAVGRALEIEPGNVVWENWRTRLGR